MSDQQDVPAEDSDVEKVPNGLEIMMAFAQKEYPKELLEELLKEYSEFRKNHPRIQPPKDPGPPRMRQIRRFKSPPGW